MSNRCTSRASKLTAAEEVCECPNLWHLKQRRGFGIYGRTLQFKYPALMFDGNLGLLKVRIKFLVGKRDESFFTEILLTWVTPWSESPSKISVSEEDKRSGSEMTPRHEFNDLCSRLVSHQIVVFLIDFGSPPIPIIALWTTKGDFRAISQFGNDKIKKLEHLATLSIRRLSNPGHEFKESMVRAS
ncbi:hypothetical protein TNCV_65131 [Trichonephila clavipes]|nr:hypothetical protein TNCV_65131 [Trichonephila clavipes]